MTAIALAVQQVLAELGDLTTAVGNLVAVILRGEAAPAGPRLAEGLFLLVNPKGDPYMYVVKADAPDNPYLISYKVVDSEGNVVASPEGMIVEEDSTDPGVVAVTQDPTDPNRGTVRFGAPGLASVNVTIKLPTGELVGSFGAQFTVTAGDPSAIQGGTIVFPGLEEAPAPPQPGPTRSR